jgi:hypothetical protein
MSYQRKQYEKKHKPRKGQRAGQETVKLDKGKERQQVRQELRKAA